MSQLIPENGMKLSSEKRSQCTSHSLYNYKTPRHECTVGMLIHLLDNVDLDVNGVHHEYSNMEINDTIQISF